MLWVLPSLSYFRRRATRVRSPRSDQARCAGRWKSSPWPILFTYTDNWYEIAGAELTDQSHTFDCIDTQKHREGAINVTASRQLLGSSMGTNVRAVVRASSNAVSVGDITKRTSCMYNVCDTNRSVHSTGARVHVLLGKERQKKSSPLGIISQSSRRVERL